MTSVEREAKELYLELAELSDEAREARLSAASLRQEVVERARCLLRGEKLAQEGLPEAAVVQRDTEPTRLVSLSFIGPYRVIKVLGYGGMGVVYRAEQEHPKREVAVKVLGTQRWSDQLARRLEREAEILARLKHPGIAQVYEAGRATIDGREQPYFAMELVEGSPLLQYGSSLDEPSRMRLMAQVCDAVAYAHSKGIVHRDLKPGNVIVDSSGCPKVLDFGIARFTEDSVDSPSLQTSEGQILGTIAYMSPEQAAGRGKDVDQRTDVYSLGIMAYELLTGRLPYKAGREGNSIALLRAVREEEPVAPSTVSRSLGGDIETVLLTALDKDPARRYQTAQGFGDDLRRCLADEPITARPATTAYQLRKFVHRNRTIVGSTALAFLALAIGLALSLYFLTKSRAAESERATELARSKQNEELLLSVLDAANPARAKGRDRSLILDIFRGAEQKLDSRLLRDSATRAALQRTMGRSYLGLGEYAHAERLLRSASETLTSSDKAPVRDRLACSLDLSTALWQQGQTDAASDLLLSVLRDGRASFGENDPVVLSATVQLATVRYKQARLDEAESLFEIAMTHPARETPEGRLAIAFAASNLSTLFATHGPPERALEVSKQALDILERERGSSDPDAIRVRGNRGTILLRLNKPAEAAVELEHAWQDAKRVFGDEHESTLRIQNMLCVAYTNSGAYSKALPIATETYAIRAKLDGPESVSTMRIKNNLVDLYLKSGQHKQAQLMVTELIESARRTLSPESENLGGFLLTQGEVQVACGELDAAEHNFLDAYHILAKSKHSLAAIAAQDIVQLYEAQGKAELARDWKARIPK